MPTTPPRYAVFADIFDDPHNPNVNPDDYPIWCDTQQEAIDLMDILTRDTGVGHFIMERTITADPPEPVSLEEVYAVRPGVDFPYTLNP